MKVGISGARKRWIVYAVILLGIVLWKYLPRPWHPNRTVDTAHYAIASTATQAQTVEIGRVVELQYQTYAGRFGGLPGFQPDHGRLKILLYKDRQEFRWVNPDLGWAEAYYSKPYCRAYYSAAEANPYHWMLHEAVHQMNAEVAHLHLAKWLEEGTAEYFSASRIQDGRMIPGRIDRNTYPVWWLNEIATTPELSACVANGSIIPLQSIVTGRGGPSMDRQFNLYYLHWWTLTHFLFESPKYREAALRLMQEGGELGAFEKNIGPVDTVQQEWFRHVRTMKGALDGKIGHFYKTGELPPDQ